MSGSLGTASLYCWRMLTPASFASRIERQLWQTTLTAWPNVRMAVAAPQFGQLTDRTVTSGRPLPSGILPAFEGAHVSEAQLVEIDRLTDVQHRRIVAVV